MFVKTILRRFGETVDRNYLKKVGATIVPGSELALLLVCYHPFEGKTALQVSDQLTINPGDSVGEFHLANNRIIEIAAVTEKGLQWQLMEMLRVEFKTLAIACKQGIIPEEVHGFYGVNVLPAGARRLGFTLIPIAPGWERLWLGFWESALRLIFYSFKTKKKPTIGKTMDPYQIWISRADILKLYLPEKDEIRMRDEA